MILCIKFHKVILFSLFQPKTWEGRIYIIQIQLLRNNGDTKINCMFGLHEYVLKGRKMMQIYYFRRILKNSQLIAHHK